MACSLRRNLELACYYSQGKRQRRGSEHPRGTRIVRTSLQLVASIQLPYYSVVLYSYLWPACIYLSFLIFSLMYDPSFALTFSISFCKSFCIRVYLP